MQTRIIGGTVIHQGKGKPIYIPQIKRGRKWADILEPGSYILQEGYNRLRVCEKCGGDGCSHCVDGLRKAEPKNLKYIAEMFLQEFKELVTS